MIPAFPIFKKIELEDKPRIDFHTEGNKPYSDFNFTNLWAWDTKGERMISELNENLVVRFTDYMTGEPFLSFLGAHDCAHTARELLQYAKSVGIAPVLQFIPEEGAENLRVEDLRTEADADNFDYIFSIAELADPQGSKFKKKRQQANKFLRENPGAVFKTADLKDAAVQAEVIALFRRWKEEKKSDTKYDLELEDMALGRLLRSADTHTLILSCVYLDETMIGFSVDELLPENYALSHFLKADISFRGIYEFLNQKAAEHLLAHGAVLWNWEQDLNIEGLRQLKMSYRPADFLRKYKTSFI